MTNRLATLRRPSSMKHVENCGSLGEGGQSLHGGDITMVESQGSQHVHCLALVCIVFSHLIVHSYFPTLVLFRRRNIDQSVKYVQQIFSSFVQSVSCVLCRFFQEYYSSVIFCCVEFCIPAAQVSALVRTIMAFYFALMFSAF